MNEFVKDDVNIIGANASDVRTISAIHGALSNILSDEKFLASPQMSAFLTYVVQETMAGNADRIKAYTVAVDALGKPASFDPQSDPSVRVLANRLRASLKNYYASNPEQALFIKLYTGSYVPHFVDSTGYEHVQRILKNKPADSTAPLLKPYEKIENLCAPPNSVNAIRSDKQHSTDSVDRVNAWLLGGGNKYS
ncbi:MAG: hypothetical protein V3U65_00255 [Granulosicoccaceae bacterium]